MTTLHLDIISRVLYQVGSMEVTTKDNPSIIITSRNALPEGPR
jgi:hypothetical protein